jgi:hypothetical protein
MAGVEADTKPEQGKGAGANSAMNAEVATLPSNPRAPVRRWWQFSLVTLLLLAVIAALAVGYCAAAKRLAEAQRELQQANRAIADFRAELGYFEVDDPKMVYMRAAPTLGDLSWKWRVYLPAGRKWAVLFGVGQLSSDAATATPERKKRILLNPGRATIEICVDSDGAWFLSVKNEGRIVGYNELITRTNLHDTSMANYSLYGYGQTMLQAGQFETEKQDAATQDRYFLLTHTVARLPAEVAPLEDPTRIGNYAIWAWIETSELSNLRLEMILESKLLPNLRKQRRRSQ